MMSDVRYHSLPCGRISLNLELGQQSVNPNNPPVATFSITVLGLQVCERPHLTSVLMCVLGICIVLMLGQ